MGPTPVATPNIPQYVAPVAPPGPPPPPPPAVPEGFSPTTMLTQPPQPQVNSSPLYDTLATTVGPDPDLLPNAPPPPPPPPAEPQVVSYPPPSLPPEPPGSVLM